MAPNRFVTENGVDYAVWLLKKRKNKKNRTGRGGSLSSWEKNTGVRAEL